ncbi:glycerophosphodiester phosphodiesterase family protein [Pontixanthobacter gangjinensis]
MKQVFSRGVRPIMGLMVALFTTMSVPSMAQIDQPLIIAHRGASAERPEHTLAAYERAIDQGADYIEPDLVVTKDGVLVSRHENEISSTTDIASREEFADRRRSKTIDGQLTAGWFAEDFTLEELRTLRAKERLPGVRSQNVRYDGLYQIPTLEEVVKLVRAKQAETGRKIGIYPELKYPEFLLQEEGIDMVDLLLSELRELGVTPDDPIFIQCFEIGPLQRLNKRSAFKLVQLVKSYDGPADEPAMSYAEMITPTGLAAIAEYADALGAEIPLILQSDGTATMLVANAKAAGIAGGVHAWTVRPENVFLPPALRLEGGENAQGNSVLLNELLRRAGVTGIFTDDPATSNGIKTGQKLP